MNRTAPHLRGVHHIKLCYSKGRYCGHPRQSPFRNFGGGEIAVSHFHAPATYATRENITHGHHNYMGRSQVLLQRSLDHGETWLPENDTVIWDHSRPLAERQAILHRADEPGVAHGFGNVPETAPAPATDDKKAAKRASQLGIQTLGVAREEIDLSSPDSMVAFPRHATGPENPEGLPTLECFAVRSGDRGRTWETVGTRLTPPPDYNFVSIDGDSPIQFPDGTFVAPAWLDNRNSGSDKRDYYSAVTGLYGSDDSGISWKYLAEVSSEPPARGRHGYSNLILLPSGRLQCYFNRIDNGLRNTIELTYSDDGGYSWSAPQPIVAWGNSPWASRHRPGDRWNGWFYRSQWPLRLRDGRIVVVFGRRKSPSGIGLIVSEDDGATWSAEAIVRDDGSGGDLGYPVATQLDDGRIFTAYYFMEADGNNFGGTRHLAGSFFELT